MTGRWPPDWDERVAGLNCEMCQDRSPEVDAHGIRIYQSTTVDAVLQSAHVQRGYTLVIWRGRHVVEPFDLSDHEAAQYWREVMKVAKALAQYYRPLKMNYETLGNTVPHLHTHLLPRFEVDPAPGRPFPLVPQDGSEIRIDGATLDCDASILQSLLK